jgi:SPOR domain
MEKKEKTSPNKKKSSTQWTRKGLTLWIFVTFFVCAWMFVLGIFVGRGTAPVKFDMEKLQKELVDLKEALIKKEVDRYKLDSPSADNITPLGFPEALKHTGGEERLKADIPKKNPKPLREHTVSKTKKPLVSRKAATTRKKKTATIKKSVKENKNFTIQVAALKDSKIADNMVAKFKKRGYPAYRSMGKNPEKGIVYRIRIGYFKNRAEASSTFNRLKKENIKAIIVQR